MAVPVLRGSATSAKGAATAAPANPTGLATGDLDILVAVCSPGSYTLSISNNGGGAWSSFPSPLNAQVTVTSGATIRAWYRIASVGSDSAPTVTAGGVALVTATRFAYQAGTFDAATPFEALNTYTETTSDTSFSMATGVSTTDVDRKVVCAASVDADSNTGQVGVMANTSLTTLALLINVCTNAGTAPPAGTSVGVGATHGDRLAAGTTGTFTVTYGTASPKASITFAVRPLAATPVTVVCAAAAAAGSGRSMLLGLFPEAASAVAAGNEITPQVGQVLAASAASAGATAPTVTLLAGFDPTQIAGLLGWWKADAIVGLNDGDAVASWADSSSGGNAFTQADPTKQPVYKTAIANGLPVLRFDGTNDGMASAASRSSPSAFTLLCVYARQANADDVGRAVQGTSGNNWLIGPYVSIHQLYAGSWATPNGPSVTLGAFIVHTATQNASAAVSFVNGTQYGTVATPGYPGAIALGAGGEFSDPLNGDIGEVVLYDSVLSPADRQAVEDYLAAKWIAAAAPVTLTCQAVSATATGGEITLQVGETLAATAAAATATGRSVLLGFFPGASTSTATGGTATLVVGQTLTAGASSSTATGRSMLLGFFPDAASATATGGNVDGHVGQILAAGANTATATTQNMLLAFWGNAATATATGGTITPTVGQVLAAGTSNSNASGDTISLSVPGQVTLTCQAATAMATGRSILLGLFPNAATATATGRSILLGLFPNPASMTSSGANIDAHLGQVLATNPATSNLAGTLALTVPATITASATAQATGRAMLLAFWGNPANATATIPNLLVRGGAFEPAPTVDLPTPMALDPAATTQTVKTRTTTLTLQPRATTHTLDPHTTELTFDG
jgi:Concanavalin A-like lectin/glucanases superfamily